MSRLSRRRFLRGLGLAGAGLAALGAGAGSTYGFTVSRHRRGLKGLRRPLRVAQLSDLHYGPWVHAAQVRAWVQAALDARPDLIVLTGDLIDAGLRLRFGAGLLELLSADLGELLEPLSKLAAPLGVFSVWGNHDNDPRVSPAKALLAEGLPRAGVRVLVNDGLLLRTDLFLAGVDDFFVGDPDGDRAVRTCPPDAACLMLCHNPDYLDRLPRRCDLTLCGHTHGGQVRLPLVGAPWTPSYFGQKFLQGWFSEPLPAFVSRGLGMTGLPLRLGARAEVVVFDFQPL